MPKASQAETSVKYGFFVPDDSQRGISQALYTAVDFNRASEFRSVLQESFSNGFGFALRMSDIEPGGEYRFGDGTESRPSIAFEYSNKTGFYRIGADNLGITLGGTKRWDLGTSVGFTTLDFGVGATPTARLHITQAAGTSGTPNPALKLTGGAHTTLAASTEAIDADYALDRTVQFSTGALTTQRAVLFRAPTYGFVGATTITNAATVAISGAPVAGTNATITNRYAFWVQDNYARFDGRILVNDGNTTLPSIAFTGDTTFGTGFFRNGAHEIRAVGLGALICAFSMLGTSGVERNGRVYTAGTLGVGSVSTGARCYVTDAAQSDGNAPVLFYLNAAAHTSVVNTERIDADFSLNRTLQFTGGLATQRAIVLRAPTYSSTVASTITDAATLAITGAPVAGTNMTLTNSYALWVQAGKAKLVGDVDIDGTLKLALIDAKGDLIVGSAADTLARLAVGTNNYRLEADSTATNGIKWAVTDIGCRVTHSVDQSIPSDAVTVLSFDTERYDTDTMHNTVTNNSRITFTTAGKYIVGGNTIFPASAAGIYFIIIKLNGATTIAQERVVPSGATSTAMGISTIYNFAANDYVELLVYQNSGGAINSQKSNQSTPEFWAQKVDRGG